MSPKAGTFPVYDLVPHVFMGSGTEQVPVAETSVCFSVCDHIRSEVREGGGLCAGETLVGRGGT